VRNNQRVKQQIQSTFSEVQYLIRLLYVTYDEYMKNLTLNQLWNKIAHLEFLFELMETAPVQPQPAAPVLPPQTQPQLPQNQRTFTREQLAQFNGKNGMPAYVAVNGIVYDVTNNAAWSAATHFGLAAGQY